MMKKFEFRLWQVVLILMVSGAAGGVSVKYFSDTNATSMESHVVNSYLQSVKATPELMDRFREVNGNWPPSKNKLATLMLDVATEAATTSRQ